MPNAMKWIAILGVYVGLACLVLAAITGLTGQSVFNITGRGYVTFGNGAFLFAIAWALIVFTDAYCTTHKKEGM